MKAKTTILTCIISICIFSLSYANNIGIIPKPQELIELKESFTLNSNVCVVSTLESFKTAFRLQEYLKEEFGIHVEIKDSKAANDRVIIFKKNTELEKEAYELHITEDEIQIIASNSTGWFYGIQSLKQLFPVPSDSSRKISFFDISGVIIKDSPRFAWRAFMLDEARYFKGMEQVKMLLDEMALLKMNVFHWHLVDDQGWRIEIKKYPLLTQIGSKRKSTQIGPLHWKSPIQSAETHEGFYTQEEIKEIIKYADDRHITIVPEIEMPGHSSAAIASYSWLGTAKKDIDVPIMFGVGKDVYDVSDPKVYQFLTDVLDEVIELFPSKVIHIGGDEVKYDHWKKSASVQAYMHKNNLSTPAELQVFFTNSISQYLQGKDRRMMGWNEIMGHNLHEYQDESDTHTDLELAKESVIHFWKGDIDLLTQAASNGYDIVNSLHSETYLDYTYKNLPLSRAYAFNPIPAKLNPKYHDKVIGTGCQMWGEWIPTDGEMHFQVFPRIAAYAEVGWTQSDNKNFDEFVIALQKLKKYWKQKGIYFAPDPFVGILPDTK
jgi:hexosaminidase